MRRRTLILAGLAIAVLIGFYIHGSFDRALSGIGLNLHRCARNGLGATFCNKELTEYEERVERAKRAGEEAKTHIEGIEQKAKEEQHAGEQTRAAEAVERRTEQEHELARKMEREKAIIVAEPEGSYASDLAKDELEADRAQAQQLLIEQQR